MDNRYTRRDLIRIFGASGVAAGLNCLAAPSALPADEVVQNGGFSGRVVDPEAVQATAACPTLVGGKVIQPRRELTVHHATDVLVVGAGTAGVTAAIAARRAGAQVTLLERYGHLGGLWSGGLVLIVVGHIVKGGKQVCQGIGEEMLRRLEKIGGGIVNRRPGVNPTVDAEALKYVMVDMVQEAGVRTLLHCWGVEAIMDGTAVRGAVFESKSGRQAILAKTVVDATGDGDLFASAGAMFRRCRYNIGLVSRLGNVDKVDRARSPRDLGGPTPDPGVTWVNMLGPVADGLDVAELSRLEMDHRRAIWQNLRKIRDTPGYEPVFLLETAPQLGVRITRLLRGVKTLTMEGFKAGAEFSDVVALGGADGLNHGPWQIPYGALVPKSKVENILAAGRCISAELKMADMVRVIPICWVTGHAAGVAAAVAVQDRCRVRDVDVSKVQRVLKQQEAILSL